jgi:hypothetical protein
VQDDDMKHLNWLAEHADGYRVVKLLVNTGEQLVRRKSDGVIVVPAAALGV